MEDHHLRTRLEAKLECLKTIQHQIDLITTLDSEISHLIHHSYSRSVDVTPLINELESILGHLHLKLPGTRCSCHNDGSGCVYQSNGNHLNWWNLDS